MGVQAPQALLPRNLGVVLFTLYKMSVMVADRGCGYGSYLGKEADLICSSCCCWLL